MRMHEITDLHTYQRNSMQRGDVCQVDCLLFGSITAFLGNIHIVYVIKCAAYRVIYTSCLCQKPERGRAFDTNNE